jgi:hypothetical protein
MGKPKPNFDEMNEDELLAWWIFRHLDDVENASPDMIEFAIKTFKESTERKEVITLLKYDYN